LHDVDFEPAGFEWIDRQDADASVLSFLRRPRHGPPVLIICNFTPVPRTNYTVDLQTNAYTIEGKPVLVGQRHVANVVLVPSDARRRTAISTPGTDGALLATVPEAGAALGDAAPKDCRRTICRPRGVRAVIETITPAVDGGCFAVKRIAGDRGRRADCSPTDTTCSPCCDTRANTRIGAKRRWRRSATTAGAARSPFPRRDVTATR
jgi:hypothetical protein